MIKLSKRAFASVGMSAALAVATVGFGSASAFAAESNSISGNCTTANKIVTCTFLAGLQDWWTAPQGVTKATFTLKGAAGGSSDVGTQGGEGGQTSADVSFTPGDLFQINTGSTGTSPSDYNEYGFGGRNGGANGALGNGGGGGATDVRKDRDGNYGLKTRLLVAGGGGGGGGSEVKDQGFTGGNGGGLEGSDGGRSDYPKNVGKGGSQLAGGEHGGWGIAGGWDGSLGNGGAANDLRSNWYGGGGGGGGYFGGGGGGRMNVGSRDGGGGGGGSGFASPVAWVSGAVLKSGGNPGGGSVTITYSLPQ